MLGDLGADVIKVENPNQPDAARTLLVVASADMEMPTVGACSPCGPCAGTPTCIATTATAAT